MKMDAVNSDTQESSCEEGKEFPDYSSKSYSQLQFLRKFFNNLKKSLVKTNQIKKAKSNFWCRQDILLPSRSDPAIQMDEDTLQKTSTIPLASIDVHGEKPTVP